VTIPPPIVQVHTLAQSAKVESGNISETIKSEPLAGIRAIAD
jgi:hypothetical protein